MREMAGTSEREIVNLQRSLADALTAQANIRETAEAKLALHNKCSAEDRDALQEHTRSVEEENKKLRAMINGMKESAAGLADAMQTLKQRHQEMGMQLDEVQKTVQKAVSKEDAAGDEPPAPKLPSTQLKYTNFYNRPPTKEQLKTMNRALRSRR